MTRKVGPYWDPEGELLSGDSLERRQSELLRELVAAAATTAFYQRRFQQAGLDPACVRSVADLQRLPITTKEDTRASQQLAPPWGDYTAVPMDEIMAVHMSSGTTGVPTANLYTRRDYDAIAERSARAAWAQGVRPGDICQVAYTYRLFAGGWSVHMGLLKLGAATIPIGTGGSVQQIEIMQRYGTTVFFGTPSYAMALYETARNMGIEPKRDLRLRKMQLSGEPGASIPAVRSRIEEMWGVKVYDYPGQSEALGWCGSCGEQTGVHINEDHFIVEILHPETREPVAAGEPGVAVLTNLRAYAQPLLRWWTNDIVEVTDEPCPCGRPSRRLAKGFLSRADDMLKVSGTRIWPAGVEEVLRVMPGFGGEFRIVIDNSNLTAGGALSKLKLRVEASSDEPSHDALRRRVEQQIHARFAISPLVEIVAPGSLDRFEMKAQRILRETGAR